jgi:hypothetical protein
VRLRHVGDLANRAHNGAHQARRSANIRPFFAARILSGESAISRAVVNRIFNAIMRQTKSIVGSHMVAASVRSHRRTASAFDLLERLDHFARLALDLQRYRKIMKLSFSYQQGAQ